MIRKSSFQVTKVGFLNKKICEISQIRKSPPCCLHWQANQPRAQNHAIWDGSIRAGGRCVALILVYLGKGSQDRQKLRIASSSTKKARDIRGLSVAQLSRHQMKLKKLLYFT